jgi:TNF receptor-associated factor 4
MSDKSGSSNKKKKKREHGAITGTANEDTNNGEGGSGPNRFTYFAASGLSDDRWLCPICLDIFEDAVETPCCHNLFCEQCIKRTPSCPLCNLRINHLDGLKPNIPIRRLVLELSVPCQNDNCDEIIRKGEIEKHNKICNFTPLPCPHNTDDTGDGPCGWILRRDLSKHTNEECSFRMVECLLLCG